MPGAEGIETEKQKSGQRKGGKSVVFEQDSSAIERGAGIGILKPGIRLKSGRIYECIESKHGKGASRSCSVQKQRFCKYNQS